MLNPAKREGWSTLARRAVQPGPAACIWRVAAAECRSPGDEDFEPLDRIAISIDGLSKLAGLATPPVVGFELRGGSFSQTDTIVSCSWKPTQWTDGGPLIQVAGVSVLCFELWATVGQLANGLEWEGSVIVGRGVGGSKLEIVKGSAVV
jgi:hypothetical protein